MGFNVDTTMRVYWSKAERDYLIAYPKKSHGWIMWELLESDAFKLFKQSIEKMGYDTTTIKISCKLKGDE